MKSALPPANTSFSMLRPVGTPRVCRSQIPAVCAAVCSLALAIQPLLAGAPTTLLLISKPDKSLPVSPVESGMVAFEVPGRGTFYIAPQAVDTASGGWKSAKVVSNFPSAEGARVEGTADFQWQTGGTATITLNATMKGNRLDVRLSWVVAGDASGHIRADILVPHEIAKTLTVKSSEGKTVFQDGTRGTAGKAPATFLDASDNSTIFTVEADGCNVSVGSITNFEARGAEVRISPYPSGGKGDVAAFQSMELSIIFP